MTDVMVARFEGLGTLTTAGRQFARWWLNELRECTPKAWGHLLQAETATRLYIYGEQGACICRLDAPSGAREKRFAAGHFNRVQLDAWLGEIGCLPETVRIGVALEASLFFQRQLKLPRSELDALERVLEQEIVHRTPFQPAGIWHGATPADEPAAVGVVKFCHWIIPKDRAEAEIARLGLQVSEIDFIAARQPFGTPLSVIDFSTKQRQDPLWVGRATRTLAVALIAAAVLALVAVEWWQSTSAARLEDALYEAKHGVLNGAQPPGSSFRLFALKAEPGTLAVWDELSRVIPDHTFLTEVRIFGSAVTLSGLSSDAARLVRALDGSRVFVGATLAGAITPDPTEQKDRFRMTLKLRKIGADRGVKAPEKARS